MKTNVTLKLDADLLREARHQVSFWDALVIQAAQASGAELLSSEDLSDGQAYGRLRVVNPFAHLA